MAKRKIIRIINTPEGPDVPKKINKGWIGTEHVAEGPLEMEVSSALSQGNSQGVKLVFLVPRDNALTVLKFHNKKSWEWFRGQAVLAPIFAFDTNCCKVID